MKLEKLLKDIIEKLSQRLVRLSGTPEYKFVLGQHYEANRILKMAPETSPEPACGNFSRCTYCGTSDTVHREWCRNSTSQEEQTSSPQP